MSDRGVSRTANDSEENQIDLTPMLDVVFIMLIFFIVTSSFVKEPGVELLKPQAVTTEQCTRGTIIFAVDDRGDIHYNKNKIPLERAAFLAEAAKKGKGGGKKKVRGALPHPPREEIEPKKGFGFSDGIASVIRAGKTSQMGGIDFS